MRKLTFVITILLLSVTVKSQFKVDAEYRIRSEFKDGLKTLSDSTKNPAFTTVQRTRLNIGFKDEKLEVYLSLFDVRVWGETAISKDVPVMGVHQAYIQYRFNDNLAVKLGRQELLYDDQRLLGVKNWNNIGAAHDVALLKYKNEKTVGHFGFAYNNDTDKDFESDYDVSYFKYLSFLWIHHKFSDQLDASLMNIFDGNQKEGDYKTIYTRGTSGFFLNYSLSNISVEVNPSIQYGKSAGGGEAFAYFFHVKPAWNASDKLILEAGLDYFSGSDAFDPGKKLTAFSNLYGSGHAFCGHMDYFTDIQKQTKNGGLNDIYVTANFKVNDKLSFYAALHNFQFTNNVIDSVSAPGLNQKADKQLGTELDLSLKYKFYPKAEVSLGYSTLVPSESMEILKGGDSDIWQHWLWVSIQFKPDFFISETKK